MMKTMTILFSIQTLFYKNHISLLMMIISICLLMSSTMFLLSMKYWNSILIVLIFISGIMVLFLFVISLAPNEKFTMKNLKKMVILIMILNGISFMMKFSYNNHMFYMNSNYSNNPLNLIMIFIFILMAALIPPKLMLQMYKGMKSTK